MAFWLPLCVPAHAAVLPVLRLGAANWPPYSIKGSELRPGLAQELLTPIVARLGLTLEVVHLPWSRALVEARNGRLDGLLTATPAEAHGLALTRQSTFVYEVVFLTRADSSWRYQGSASLKEVRLGVVPDYGYGEPIDSHVAEERGPLMRISGSESVPRLIKLLQLGRIDAMAEDRQVVQWHAARGQVSMQGLREAGSLGPQPVFVALHPQRAQQDQLLKRLDAELAKPSTRTELERLRASYLSAAQQESTTSGN